jgi:branched-chain amino acid transport system permease protein
MALEQNTTASALRDHLVRPQPAARIAAFFAHPFPWLVIAVTMLFVALPLWGSNVQLRESLLLAAVYITLASNLNLMIGYAGYVNFGNIVFFGLGGYFCVFFISALGLPLVVAMLAAGLVVSALALLFGLGILGLRGAFFALATIGINEAIKAFITNFEPWGGASGIYMPLDVYAEFGGPASALWVVYFLLVAVMAASLFLSYAIKTSKFGMGLIAIGQNEDAAAVLGVPTRLYKSLAYGTSAFLPAVAGGLYYFKSAFIEPASAFDLSASIEAIVMVMLGGHGTVTGPALGAFLYEQLRGALLTAETFSHFQLVIAGAVLLLIVLFAPGGLMGLIYRLSPRLRKYLP